MILRHRRPSTKRTPAGAARRGQPRRPAIRPVLEILEDRTAPATFTVTTANDGTGIGSLRDAINFANANPGTTIDFKITTGTFNGSWWTITLNSALPAITANGTIIDGTSQPGYSTSPLLGSATQTVGVGGTLLGQFKEPVIAIDAAGNDGLDIGSASTSPTGVVIKALDIYDANAADFGNAGAVEAVSGSGNLVEDMFVGTLPDGMDPGLVLRNQGFGIFAAATVDSGAAAGAQLNIVHCYTGWNGFCGMVARTSGSTSNDGSYGSINATFSELFDNGWNSDSQNGADLAGVNCIFEYNYSHDNIAIVQPEDILANGGGYPDAELGTNQPNGDGGNGVEVGTHSAGSIAIRSNNVIEQNTLVDNVSAGVQLRKGTFGNLVAGNVITGNYVGIAVRAEDTRPAYDDQISQNSIFGNTYIGIDLTPDIMTSANQPVAITFMNNMLPPPPSVNATGGGAAGGALAAGTYYVEYTYVTADGETTASLPSAQFTVASGNQPQVNFGPLPAGVTSVNLYVTPANGPHGSEVLYASGITSSTYTMSMAAPNSATTPPFFGDTAQAPPSYTFQPQYPNPNPAIVPSAAGPANLFPNFYENYPILNTATLSGTTLTVSGTLQSYTGTFTVEFFASAGNPALDATGSPEGQNYIGSFPVTVTGAGPTSFTAILTNFKAPAGTYYITATATGAGPDTAAPTTLSGSLTAKSNVVRVATAGLFVGELVSGTGIPANTAIASIGIGSITLTNKATATGTRTLSFAPATLNTSELSPAVIPTIAAGGSLSGYVFLDLNGNGIREANDRGIANAKVSLYLLVGSKFVLKAITHTNRAGLYAFSFAALGLGTGVYRIVLTQPPGLRPGRSSLGTVAGVPEGIALPDEFDRIEVRIGQHGVNYNFAQLPSKTAFIF